MSKATSSKAAGGSSFLRRAVRPSVRDTGSSPGPLPRPAVLFGTPATGGQCDHVHRAPARLQAGAAFAGLPGDCRGGFRQETRSRNRGLGCGLGSQGLQTFSEAEGARLERTPGPGIAEGGWGASLPRPIQGQACCLEGWEFGSLGAWKVQRPRKCGPRRGGGAVRPLRAERPPGEGGGTLTASPEAKGSLPRDPSEVQNKAAILAAP